MQNIEDVRNIIIYQKSNNDIFIRMYKHDLSKKIGDETSMGWKVLNVLYEYEGNYYQYDKYMRLIREKTERQRNKKRIRKAIKKSLYNSISLNLRKLEKHIY